MLNTRRGDELCRVVRCTQLTLLAFLLLWVGLRVHPALAAADTPQDTNETTVLSWYRDLLDNSAHTTGGSQSLAINSAGTSFISFYDATSKDLHVARSSPPNLGNCGPGNAWTCMTVDSAGDVGASNAIAENPITHLPAIAYSGDAGHSLRYAEATVCSGAGCTWTLSTIRSNVDAVYDLSLVFASNGTPHIAYREGRNAQNPNAASFGALMYVKRVGSGGNCGNTVWSCDAIDEASRDIIDLSLDLDSNGRPRIAYTRYNKPQNSQKLPSDVIYAAYTINSGTCGPKIGNNFTWTCHTLVSSPDYNFGPLAMRINGSTPHIAYWEYQAKSLNYATLDFNNLNGNCGPQ